MSSTFEDSVLDFDINLFQQSSNNAVVPTNKDKVRKAIFISKRKIMSTDSLIRKFYDKRLGCKALERCLLTSKEEYKQACIESMEYREKCAALEEEIKKMQASNLELENKCNMADNRYDGMQSHAKQLQQLVKENETQIESLKIEHKLERANFKEQEKKFANLQKEHEQLIKNICSISEVILGKKKLTKELKLFLTKYGTSNDSGANSCDEADTFDTPMSPLSDSGECNEELVLAATKGIENKIGAKLEGLHVNEGHTPTRDDNDHDSECSNEVVSLDTGRGSSLAFSDSDKCFNSPEYFSQHSPLSAEVVRNKDKITVDIATSPAPLRQLTNVSTSPIIFESLECMAGSEKESSSPTKCSCENINARSGSIPTIMIDRVVSPIILTRSVEKSTSPLKNATKNIAVATSPFKLGDTTPGFCSNGKHQNMQEKECLELNTSNYLEDENSNDGEIQMILDTMRFSQKLITPLPTTPAKSRTLATGNSATQTVLQHSSMCPDAAKIREENITLQATVAKLANDIVNINNILQKLNPLINKAGVADTGCTPLLSNDDIVTAKETKIQHDQKLEHNLVQKIHVPEEIPSGIEKLEFNDKKSKLKRLNNLLFADFSPPTSSDGFLPPLHRAQASLFSPAPSPPPPASPLPPASPSPPGSPQPPQPVSPPPFVLPPPPASPLSPVFPPPQAPPPLVSSLPPDLPKISVLSSPPPASPRTPVSCSPPASPAPPASPQSPDSLRLVVDIDDASFNDDYESNNNNLKTKERMQFEESLSNRGILEDDANSDYDVYEHEIVIELGPDCLESDTNSLHEILKEQGLKEKLVSEDKDTKKPAKTRKTTKLEKLRKKMMPKGKIKKVDILSKRKRRIQLDRKLIACKEKTKSDSFIDNKTAYEKACKVMAEIKSKEKDNKKTGLASRLPPLSRKKNVRKTTKSTEPAPTSNQLENTQENKIVSQTQSVVNDGIQEITCENSPRQSTRDKHQKVEDISKPVSEAYRGRQRTARTRSQSKSISNDNSVSVIQDLDGKDLINNTKEGSCDNLFTPHMLSPSQTRPVLKMYGRNRDKNNSDNGFTSSRHNVTNFTKPCLPAVTEEINYSTDTVQSSECRKSLKRASVDKPHLSPKRILRSSSVLHSESEVIHNESESLTEMEQTTHVNKRLLNYEDLDMFNETPVKEKQNSVPETAPTKSGALNSRRAEHPKFGILCACLDKYGGKSQKSAAPKVSENVVNTICKKLEDDIAEIQKLSPKDTKQAMDKLVQDLQSRKKVQFLLGLIKYLKDPARKIELYNKVYVPPAPPMTKAEQILIYLVSQLKCYWSDIVENILKNIEYSLFMLNRTPEFEAIETLSHFYAVLCRYDKNRNRLRLFIIDAMYCLQYKAVPLIRQCLDVWMHILPLAHMGIAKNPLVTCLVYLLHFYKCEDKFNRVQEIRNILNRKYFYDMSEWNEMRILEMFRTSIIELRDIAVEKKMLRMALIILAKRHGARWCQNYIVKNMLLPIMEQSGTPERVKCFCVSLLGPLLKPYPMEMKVNCEIVMNQLSDMLNRNPSKQMEEAVFTSLIYMSRHNQNRVIKALLFWKPENISKELEDLLKSYIKERPMKSWKTVLSKISLHQT